MLKSRGTRVAKTLLEKNKVGALALLERLPIKLWRKECGTVGGTGTKTKGTHDSLDIAPNTRSDEFLLRYKKTSKEKRSSFHKWY